MTAQAAALASSIPDAIPVRFWLGSLLAKLAFTSRFAHLYLTFWSRCHRSADRNRPPRPNRCRSHSLSRRRSLSRHRSHRRRSLHIRNRSRRLSPLRMREAASWSPEKQQVASSKAHPSSSHQVAEQKALCFHNRQLAAQLAALLFSTRCTFSTRPTPPLAPDHSLPRCRRGATQHPRLRPPSLRCRSRHSRAESLLSAR